MDFASAAELLYVASKLGICWRSRDKIAGSVARPPARPPVLPARLTVLSHGIYTSKLPKGLREEFESQQDEWKAVYDSTEPEKEPFPGRWAAELTGIRSLCTLR